MKEYKFTNIVVNGFYFSVLMGNVFMSMYGKCGVLVNAHDVFETMLKQNVVSWITIIVGHTQMKSLCSLMECKCNA